MVDETMPHHHQPARGDDNVEVYPLAKKPGASFPDRITIGRTSNNDVVIADHSVSRLHAYVRRDGNGWVVADAGSKNGSWLRGDALDPRRERPIPSRALLRIGDVDLTFYIAADLFTALGGS
jgi:pSer/pThr/pTyr-binding forkhead associated (FHA) protein